VGLEQKRSRAARGIVDGLIGAVAVFHRPHPQPTAKKGAVKAVRQFLASLEIKP
jgi:hypothetical protein